MKARNAMLFGLMAAFAMTSTGETFSVLDDRGAGAALPVPTGAAAVVIEGPRRTENIVVRAADHGFSETNDLNGAAVARAIEALRAQRATRLVLAPGVYNCFDADGIAVTNLTDVTIDGCGARLVFRRDGGGANLQLRDNDHCLLENLTLDWDWAHDPLATLGTLVAKHVDEADNASHFDIRVDRPHPNYPRPVPVLSMTAIDASRTHLVGDVPDRLIYFGMPCGPKNEWIAPNVLRIWPAVDADPEAHKDLRTYQFKHYYGAERNRREVKRMNVGVSYRLLHYYYGVNGIDMADNAHLSLERVDIWSCRGFGIGVSGLQHHWQVKDCTLAPPAELLASRMVSSTADGHHVVRSLGNCIYDNFRISYCNDDSHNFHDCTSYGVPVKPNRLRVTHPRAIGYFNPRLGDTLELCEANYDKTGWRGRILAIDGNTMTMDRDVPTPKGDRFLFFNRSVATDNVVFRNCVCRDSHLRNLFQVNDVTIENCRFERMGESLWFTTAWTLEDWCEGMGVSNYVIRNCLFRENCQHRRTREDADRAAELRTLMRIPIPHAKPTPGFYENILVENCRFENMAGALFDMEHTRNLTFRNNDIFDDGTLPYRRTCRNSCFFGNCEGIRLEGNRWHLASNVPDPTVTFTADDVKDFSAHGNVREGHAR